MNQRERDERTLESWKEIAAYLQRDAKTARKWEKEEALPVHRHSHKLRSSVYAYPSEIDAWRASRKVVPEPVPLWKSLLAAPRFLAFGATLVLSLFMVGNGLRPLTVQAQQRTAMSARRVWEPPNIEMGRVSSDGRYLPYVDWKDGSLAVRDLITGQSRLLSQGSWTARSFGEAEPLVSPDGTQVAYAWFTVPALYHIRVVPLHPGAASPNPREVYRSAETRYAAPSGWTPDGREILAKIESGDKTWRLAFVPITGGAERVIKNTGWAEPEARLSPDGRLIAYSLRAKEDSMQRDIFLLAADGSRQQTLVEHPAHESLVDWTPDGNGLLFQSTRTGNWSLWIIPIEDGQAAGPPKLVKREMGRIIPSGITRNGTLYYTMIADPEDVFVASIDLEKGRVIEPPAPVNPLSLGGHNSPVWSPDGGRLAYLGPGRSIAIRSENSGEERLIFPNIEIRPNRPLRWSPDGLSLMVPGVDAKNREGLYQVDLQTAAVTMLVQGERDIPAGVYSHDGRRIFYSGPSAVLARDLKTGREQKIAERRLRDSRFTGLALSPDGKWLAIGSGQIDPGRDGVLELLPVDGGEARVLERRRGPNGVSYGQLQWTPDGRYLLYRSGVDIYRIPAAGGEHLAIGVKVPTGNRSQFSIHRDGRRIAYVAGQNKLEVWALEKFLPQPEARR
jgi:Tol biopolymer transport system component